MPALAQAAGDEAEQKPAESAISGHTGDARALLPKSAATANAPVPGNQAATDNETDNDKQKVAALLAAAKSARSRNHEQEAIRYYRDAVNREPDNVEAETGLLMALADAGKTEEALTLSDWIRHSFPSNADVQVALGYAYERLGHLVEALKAYDAALRLQPRNSSIKSARWLVASQLGASQTALREAMQQPGIDPAVIQTLREDAAAEAIRWGETVYAFQPAERHHWTDRALALLEDNIRRYPKSLRSRFDYVRALQDRHYSKRAIAEYQSLSAKNLPIPAYTHVAAGQAYLEERLPAQARNAFQAALDRDPADFQARIGLLLAYSDLNQYQPARHVSETLTDGLRDPKKQFEADMLVAWERAYEDRFGVAQSLFDKLRGGAPYSTGPLDALGTIYRWRGWPRQAKEQYELAARHDANDLDAQIGLAKADMDLGNFRAADERIKHLESVYADEPEVKKLVRRWNVHEMHEVDLDVAWSGDGNKEKGRSIHIETTLFGRPLAYQFRPFVHEYYERGQFEDDATGYYKRAGAGLDYAIPNGGRVLAEVSQEFEGDRTGGTLRFDLPLSDHWRIGAGAQSESLAVPLRARADKITGKSGEASIAYRGSDLWGVELRGERLQMSDSNQRNYGALSGNAAVVTGPYYKARIIGDIEASSNTLANTSYFNPKSDTSLLVTLQNEWLTFRRYDRSFRQRFYVSAGLYDQNSFPTLWQGKLRYEHLWQFSDTSRMTYSIGYDRDVFDGKRVYTPEFLLTGAWRF